MSRKNHNKPKEKPGRSRLDSLDETDQKLIAQLVADPNASNARLASECDISTRTVTNRLQKLFERKVIKIAARLDIHLFGYSQVAIARIENPTEEAIRILNAEHFVIGTYTAIIDNCVLMMVAFDEFTWLNNTLQDVLNQHAPEAIFFINQCVEAYKYDVNAAHLNYEQQAQVTLGDYQSRKIDRVDKIDFGIIACLMEDGRKSTRQIAKELNLTEKTVRTRTANLKEQQLIKITTIINSQLDDNRNVWICGELNVPAANLDAAAGLLKAQDNIFFAARTAGATNMNFGGVFTDSTKVQTLCRALDKLTNEKKIHFLDPNSAMLRYELLPIS